MATSDLIGVADAVIIAVVVDDDASFTGFADAVHVNARVIGVGGGCVVVASRLVLTAGDLVSVADAVIIAVVVDDDPSFTGFADACLLYTSPSPRDLSTSRMPSSA